MEKLSFIEADITRGGLISLWERDLRPQKQRVSIIVLPGGGMPVATFLYTKSEIKRHGKQALIPVHPHFQIMTAYINKHGNMEIEISFIMKTFLSRTGPTVAIKHLNHYRDGAWEVSLPQKFNTAIEILEKKLTATKKEVCFVKYGQKLQDKRKGTDI